MDEVVIIGSGAMAEAIAFDLVRHKPAYRLKIVDRSGESLHRLISVVRQGNIHTIEADARDLLYMKKIIHGASLVIGSAGYKFNFDLTRLAIESGAHWIDLGGNNDVVAKQFDLDSIANEVRVTVISDCGLAPGLVNIIGGHARETLDRIDELHFRVGGLPQHPKPPLFYSLVFSADGLANEYSEPALILDKGKRCAVESLTGLEKVSVGAPYGVLEAFHTSGGSSTMVDTFAGKVQTLDYKTLRYPGHMNRMRLLADMGFLSDKPVKLPSGGEFVPREILGAMIGDVSDKVNDVAILVASAVGEKDGYPIEITYRMIDLFDPITNLTAMARTTGFSAAIVARMILEGQITDRGVLRQELSVPAMEFFRMMKERGIDIEVTVKA